jgi:DNA-binding response OmpR family regulator
MKKILLIEDDANLAFMLGDGLESEGFVLQHFAEGEAAMNALDAFQPDIILLDVNLKGRINGFEVSKKIRQRTQTPIIFTTSRTQIEDIQEGFKIGNVDYLKKPFGIRELVLRINELLSRFPKPNVPTKNYQIGDFFFTPAEHSLQITSEKIHLQKNESKVLTILCENTGKVVSKKELLESVWSDSDIIHKEASLHNILFSIRSKLSKDNTIVLESIPKAGWKLWEKK